MRGKRNERDLLLQRSCQTKVEEEEEMILKQQQKKERKQTILEFLVASGKEQCYWMLFVYRFQVDVSTVLRAPGREVGKLKRSSRSRRTRRELVKMKVTKMTLRKGETK